LFIAEKPSLARAIADALPSPAQRRDGYIECGNGDLVGWCAGHILALAAPDAYDQAFKEWRLDHLPITPSEWKLTVTTPDLLKTLKALLARVTSVVHAGDPDREGQLLVDEVLIHFGYKGRVERVLISDLNVDAVRKAIASLQPNEKFRSLYDAAVGRQRADWLYGLNMTRLYTLLGRAAGYDGVLSVGRVQTPLLGLIVRRDIEIEKFVPKPYYTILAEIAGASHPFVATWRPGTSAEAALDSEGHLVDASVAAAIERKTAAQPAVVATATRKRQAEPPPLPYCLSDLQIDGGKRLHLGPKRILDICQTLYETHRLITYPRSDCPYLPEGHLSQSADVVRAVVAVEPRLAELASAADLTRRSRAWNDGKITAHHALIPTPRRARDVRLHEEERAVYDLVARRYLAQFYSPHQFDQLEAHLTVAGELFVAKGQQTVALGWRQVLPPSAAQADDDVGAAGRSDEKATPIPPLSTGQTLRTARTQTLAKKTTPPRRFTAASLIEAMTGIARFVSNPQIKQLLRDTDGIGTPATQASIIQTLFEREFIEEKNRQVTATATGRALIQALPEVATRPDMTALWETTLRKVHEGSAPLQGFLDAVRRQITQLVNEGRAASRIGLPRTEFRPCPGAGCGGNLRRQQGKNGPFWACSAYPACRFTDDAARVGRAKPARGGLLKRRAHRRTRLR